jgi:hypothetical protein
MSFEAAHFQLKRTRVCSQKMKEAASEFTHAAMSACKRSALALAWHSVWHRHRVERSPREKNSELRDSGRFTGGRPRGAVFNFAEAASAGNNKQGKQPSGGAEAGQGRVYATRPARANKQVADQVEATPGARDPLMRSTSEQINGPSRPIFCQDGFLATLGARLSSSKTDFYSSSASPSHRADLPLIFQFKFCPWRIFITPLALVQFFLRGSEWMIELGNKIFYHPNKKSKRRTKYSTNVLNTRASNLFELIQKLSRNGLSIISVH